MTISCFMIVESHNCYILAYTMMSSYINGAVGSLSTPHQRFDLTSDLDNGPRICAESRMQKTNIRPRVCYLLVSNNRYIWTSSSAHTVARSKRLSA